MGRGVWDSLLGRQKHLPLLAPVAPAANGVAADPRLRRLAIGCGVLLTAQILFYAAWWDWSGDDAWGLRFLIPAVLLAHALIVVTVRRQSIAFVALAAVGLAVQIPPLLIGPHVALVLMRDHSTRKPNMDQPLTYSPLMMDDMRFNPRYSQMAATGELLWLRLTGQTLHASNPVASTYVESFSPALNSADVPWDLFPVLIHQHLKQ
jgi:hypothetical protein